MMEQEKQRRCCFTGHRPEKLEAPEELVIKLLDDAIVQAAGEGFRTFVSGVSRGVDLWAAELVLKWREKLSDIRLICAVPYKGFGLHWKNGWTERFLAVLGQADLICYVCDAYSRAAYQRRNEWMVDHSALVIAAYSGTPGGTRNTIQYAEKRGVRVVCLELDA